MNAQYGSSGENVWSGDDDGDPRKPRGGLFIGVLVLVLVIAALIVFL